MFEKIRKLLHVGPIEPQSMAETALTMAESYKTFMECSSRLDALTEQRSKQMEAKLKDHRDDLQATQARIAALSPAPLPNG